MSWWPWLHPNLISDSRRSTMHSSRRALFRHPSAPLRAMIVLVDAELLPSAGKSEQLTYLLQLLASPPIEAHLYADGGPLPHAEWRTSTDTGVRAPVGWVSVESGDWTNGLAVAYGKGGKPHRAVLGATDSAVLALLNVTPTDERQGSLGSFDRERANAVMLAAAKAIRADLLVSERQLPVDPRRGFSWTTTVLSPGDALPVVGLYLRQQGKYVIVQSPTLGETATRPTHWDYGRVLFYWTAAKDLIPAAWGWSVACKAHAGATGDDTLLPLSAALEWRVEQVLRSRDRLLAALSVPQDNDTKDDALSELDAILLWLMAAFDITAQVAHAACSLSSQRLKYAAWQDEEWLKKVAKEAPAFARLVGRGTDGHRVLTIVRELRNTVHGEALSAAGAIYVVGPQAFEILVRLPNTKNAVVLDAMDKLGGHAAWGATVPLPDAELHLHPGRFVEQLLPRAFALVDGLIAATPVTRLPGVNLKPGELSGGRPRSLTEKRIRWQLGL